MTAVLYLRPTITVERHADSSASYTISDGKKSIEIGPQADVPLVTVLFSNVLHESFLLEEFTVQASPLRQITLVAGEPDYEYCLRLLSGRYEERFCIARRRENGGADYLRLTETDDLVWVGNPVSDDIALFRSAEDACLVVDGEADPTIEIHRRFMLRG